MIFFEVKNRENGLGIPVRYRVLIKKSKTTNVLKGVFGRKNMMFKISELFLKDSEERK